MQNEKVVFRLVLIVIVTFTYGCSSDKNELEEEVAIAMN